MGKIAFNKKMKKDALFHTAFELFTTKGIHKTTISDIVEKAGVAKGTFYLYFSDKYDIRNKLVSKKAGELLISAGLELKKAGISGLEDSLLFIVDYIIHAFEQNKPLLAFIAKNLNWGVFRAAMETPIYEDEQNINVYDMFLKQMKAGGESLENPDIMLFTILELVGGCCFSCILYQEPVPMAEYHPYLHKTIRSIIKQYQPEL